MRPGLIFVAGGLVFSTAALGLVIDQPCCQNMLHVPAAFGPDLLSLETPIRSRQLVMVDPADACDEIKTADLRGKIALIRRGDCNFTDKIFRVQQREAVAAVVYDNHDRERWGTIMSGVEEWVSRITIPSVFVSYTTGVALMNFTASGTEVLISLNGTGHVKPKTKQIGPIETLATYVVVSLVLLSFSGCCGLLLMLCVTCYQRAFRQRALLTLKTQTFKRPTKRSQSDSTTSRACAVDNRSASVSGGIKGGKLGRLHGLLDAIRDKRPLGTDLWRRRGRVADTSAGSAECTARRDVDVASPPPVLEKDASTRSNQESWEDEDRTCCAICLEDYEEGDVLRLLPCGHGFHDVCIKPWLLEKSEACPMCKRPAFRQIVHSTSRPDTPRSSGPNASPSRRQQNPPHPMSLESMALDEVGMFLTNNVSFFAMVILAIVTSATVLGFMAIMRRPT